LNIYEVSQLTFYLKELFVNHPALNDIWVQGEITNLALPPSGHCYFSLRDSNASIKCAMFRNQSQGSNLLSNGTSVIAHGQISIYEARGDLQIIVDSIYPEGIGEREIRLNQLRSKLEKEGLFDQSRKRTLSSFPRKIGVVTSPTGSVWQDIQTVIKRRFPLTEIYFAPAVVQGIHATVSLNEALEAINLVDDLDLIILARGGGSLEDLDAFNEESIARTVFASKAPVISAIGHETDHTIVDLVSDVRAPTPSAAAEIAVPNVTDLKSNILSYNHRVFTGLMEHVKLSRMHLLQLKERSLRGKPDFIKFKQGIDDLTENIRRILDYDFKTKFESTSSLKLRLNSLSPVATMKRGYSIVENSENGTVVTNAQGLSKNDEIKVKLYKGQFSAKITSTQSDRKSR
tara:strand:+ start:369 stop:1574 length:1206 start_codon:yes stop_codon:yes gene_type:complete